MFCTVYLLRHHGEKLDREAVRAGTRRGMLVFVRSTIGMPTRSARLLDARGVDVVPILDNAEVRFIRDGGVMLRGFNEGSDGAQTRYWRQAWWCVPRDPLEAVL